MKRGLVYGDPGMSWQFNAGMYLGEMERKKRQTRARRARRAKRARHVGSGRTIVSRLRS